MAEIDTQKLTSWWGKPLSDVERAERSERYFWWRFVAVLGLAIFVGWLGIVQVRHSTAGVRTAYELVRTADNLREQVETNRHLEARLTGLKNPVMLRREGTEKYDMHVPGADEQVEVD